MEPSPYSGYSKPIQSYRKLHPLTAMKLAGWHHKKMLQGKRKAKIRN